jgi:sec-independent protein translocase protein TatB
MFGIDAPELMVIALVALIFIGPKELPGMLRSVGKWVATARNMAGEFRGHVDEMMRQAELDELKKQVEEGTKDAVLDLQALDPTREIKAAIEEGASDAQKELDQATRTIDSATAEALPAPDVTAAEPAVGGDPAPATVSDTVVAANAEVPVASEPAATAMAGSDAPTMGAADAAAADATDSAGVIDGAATAATPLPAAANEPETKPAPKLAVG